MSDGQPQHDGSTTLASAAQAQSREPGGLAPKSSEPAFFGSAAQGLGVRFNIGASVTREVAKPYPRSGGTPLYRPLHVLTSDPAAPRLDGSVALLNIPYEKLEPGPEGRFFKVDNFDPQQNTWYRKADLDEPAALLRSGYAPSPSEPRFHQQMVYAVCSSVYASFRSALGRHVAWGFTREDDPTRLLLQPFAFEGANACYDKDIGALRFGYCVAENMPAASRSLPGGFVFSCLSHDVVAHELTHALLDGLRSHFSMPTSPDVAAFHEGFADLVAIFQRLSYKELVITALKKSHGEINSPALTSLARQLGWVHGKHAALRSATSDEEPVLYNADAEPHELGGVLMCAVFEAYLTIYKRKAAPFLRLASHGSGIISPGELQPELVDMLARTASSLASHFLSLIIRAVDYCPPVDIRLGEYLRALITADHDLVPDDPWAYREALIDAFSKRNIHPRGVPTLAEDALLWRPTRLALAPLRQLNFAHLRFEGDPACAAGPVELRRQARVLGEYATRPEHMHEFGLVSANAARAIGATAALPEVQSIRTARRVGPDGQIVFDLVAEITQSVEIAPTDSEAGYELMGGATVILGPEGEVRYVISKNAIAAERVTRRLGFIRSGQGQRLWVRENQRYVQKGQLFKMLHAAVELAPASEEKKEPALA